jgi:hypothetical protein
MKYYTSKYVIEAYSTSEYNWHYKYSNTNDIIAVIRYGKVTKEYVITYVYNYMLHPGQKYNTFEEADAVLIKFLNEDDKYIQLPQHLEILL